MLIQVRKPSTNDNKILLADETLSYLDKKYTKAGALLKGLRYRENLTQVAFAKLIGVT